MARRKRQTDVVPPSSGAERGPTDQSGIESVPERSRRLAEELRALNQRLVIAGVRQQELAEQAEIQAAQWNALLDSIADGVLVVDEHGHLVVANPAAREVLEFPEVGPLTEWRDWATVAFQYLDGRPLAYEDRPLTRALRGERFSSYEVVLVRRDGSRRRIVFSASQVRDVDGRVVLAMIVFRDVTELRQLEQVKEEYISLISHDLRLPLTIILGRAELLRRLPANASRDDIAVNVNAILANARRMNAMITDLLETTRLEAGRVVFLKEPLNLGDVVRWVVDSALSAEDRQRVHIEILSPAPPVVADRERIERVITNLLSNALKFSAAGTPVEGLVAQRDHDVVVSVTDHGPGIAPEHLAHLFGKYYQVGVAKEHGGMGLGLYLSRLIVEASGGHIWVTSTPGQGSTFSFSLPAA